MRYISKNNQTPAIITNYVTLREGAGQVVTYDDFNDKEALNNLLREEQSLICCYCQQRIDHYQQDNEAGSHNEHFIPMHGAAADIELQMDYNNLYASCNYTKGYPPEQTYCGEHKKHLPIADFIKRTDCRTFFKYNLSGEILPSGNFESIQQFVEQRDVLPQNQSTALRAIEVLNLNEAVLKKTRKLAATVMLKLASGLSQQQAQARIQNENHKETLTPFVEMLIYFLRKKEDQ